MLTQWRKPDNICIPVLIKPDKTLLGTRRIHHESSSPCRRLQLRPSYPERNGLCQRPAHHRTETEEFRDDATLNVDEMVRALRDTNGRSYSACPNVADWEGAFGERGDVIAFTITSGLSGSYGVAWRQKKAVKSMTLPAAFRCSTLFLPVRKSPFSSKRRRRNCAPAQTLMPYAMS